MWGFVQPAIPQLLPDPTPAQLHATPQPANHSQDQSQVINLSESQQTRQMPLIPNPTQETTPSIQTPLVTDRGNDPWGDIWSIKSPRQAFRVFSKNTGTINPSNLDMRAITTELQHLGASVFAAQEPNIHWDPATMHQIYTQCRQAASHAFLATSCSQEPSPDWYKPGGTLLMALGPCTSRIVTRRSDLALGRWSFIEFAGKDGMRLVVVSAYRVCNQQFDAASNTASAQQIRLLQNSGAINPQPRSIFLQDIIHQIQRWRHEHKEVLLCTDTNDNLDDPKASIAQLFSETDLINLHFHRYPALRTPPTHQRGTHTIDLMAGTPRVAEALTAAWMHPFHDPATIKGDHRLLGIDLDPDILFGTQLHPAMPTAIRGVNSRHPQKVHKFCKQVIDQCNSHYLAEQIAALQTLDSLTDQHLAELENIDTQLTKILVTADKKCAPPSQAEWSPELNRAYLRHRYWSISLTAKRTKQDLEHVLTQIRQRYNPLEEDPQSEHRSLSSNLQHAQKALRKAKREADLLRRKHLETTLNAA